MLRPYKYCLRRGNKHKNARLGTVGRKEEEEEEGERGGGTKEAAGGDKVGSVVGGLWVHSGVAQWSGSDQPKRCQCRAAASDLCGCRRDFFRWWCTYG